MSQLDKANLKFFKGKDKPYELLQAVFQVKKYADDTRAEGCTEAGMETSAVIVYVRLNGGCSRGAALNFLRDEVILKHKTSQVKFMFWCDTYVSTCGSPMILELGPSKHVMKVSR